MNILNWIKDQFQIIKLNSEIIELKIKLKRAYKKLRQIEKEDKENNE